MGAIEGFITLPRLPSLVRPYDEATRKCSWSTLPSYVEGLQFRYLPRALRRAPFPGCAESGKLRLAITLPAASLFAHVAPERMYYLR
jgi:hypothetical protein